MTRLRSEDRYENDPVFRQLVDVIYHYLDVSSENGLIVTPTDLREAAMLAAFRSESWHIRPVLHLVDNIDFIQRRDERG